ncbi:N,N-dimethylformamidase beta subunit family domain-containing protein [Jiangella muralis]|uniref:N,N-dimethylformamidase beta subunit family domain-containing protein n=1 Tax=Jiangella muralis TaxID=702383 RepID=UPI00069DCD04|nr:N,N-dimethylformamidase beta subunit family domain-containing protein [Jiangella muralis]
MGYDIIGYAPKWHARPGDKVPIHVSSRHPEFWVHLLRVTDFVDGPEAWANCAVEEPAAGPFTGVDVPLVTGSYLHARDCRADVTDVSVEVTLWTRAAQAEPSTVIQYAGDRGPLSLDLHPDGALVLRRGDEYPTGLELRPRRWTRVALAVGADGVTVTADGHQTFVRLDGPGRLRDLLIGGELDATSPSGARGRLDAKIEAPTLRAPDGAVLTSWDLGRLPYRNDVPDSHGIFAGSGLVNEPTRAVTGSTWRGRQLAFEDAPAEYAAAYLHRDDLGDAGWPVGVELELPAGARSGVLCAVLSVDEVPRFDDPSRFFPVSLFVAPPRDATPPDVTLVLPTFSYRSYANNAYWEDAPAGIYTTKGETSSKHVYDYLAETGMKSLYGSHPDGSGVHLASLRRPQATMRPDWLYQLVGRPHQLSADLSIVGWLSRSGLDWAITTDEFLDADGVAALAGSPTVLTGSHPEYSTENLLNAYDDHLAAGGNLMYLGGNGFILRVDVPADRPWIQELRRGNHDCTMWTDEPGETRHQVSGRQGGMWRYAGRPPNLLTGLGYSAVGFSRDTAYVAPADLDLDALPRQLAKVMGEIGGDPFGVCGFEIDCHDVTLGSDASCVVLGRAVDIPPEYRPVTDYLSLDDDPVRAVADAVRGDVVWRRTGAGGQVFAVGSISWTRHLSAEGDPGRCREILDAALAGMTSP